MANYPRESDSVSLPVRSRPPEEVARYEKLRMNPTPGVKFWALELLTPLPPLCTRHGLPEVERRKHTLRFIHTSRGRMQMTVGAQIRSFATMLRRFRPWSFGRGLADYNAFLFGDWPLCAACVQRSRRFQWASRMIMLAGIALICTYTITRMIVPDPDQLIPLFLCIVPGWFPIGLAAAGLAFIESRTYVRCEPTVDNTTVAIRAHPDFAAAVRAG